MGFFSSDSKTFTEENLFDQKIGLTGDSSGVIGNNTYGDGAVVTSVSSDPDALRSIAELGERLSIDAGRSTEGASHNARLAAEASARASEESARQTAIAARAAVEGNVDVSKAAINSTTDVSSFALNSNTNVIGNALSTINSTVNNVIDGTISAVKNALSDVATSNERNVTTLGRIQDNSFNAFNAQLQTENLGDSLVIQNVAKYAAIALVAIFVIPKLGK